ncbi:transient receptor potential cation channel subfamily A member 1-like isoform X2 [Dendronephthya gigantea]|nr:transient receptor potential cation channel subfamily A member 1-like isoform X2 [Dendronephthya gigantea]
MDEVRIDRVKAKHGDKYLLVIIRDWPESPKYKGKQDLVASLESQISRLTEIIMEQDTDEDFKYFRNEDNEARPTLLHYAADLNFSHVATHLVNKYPSLVYHETEVVGEERGYLAVEKALMANHDETAAFLISRMKADWVHELFLYNKDLKGPKFSFGQLISCRNPETNKHNMSKTVVAVLDSLVNPHWPYLPERKDDDNSEEIERAWSSVPDDPLDYHFYYNVLDCDDEGRIPKINDAKNNEFDVKSKSCLRRLTESKNKEAITHPVVRMLVLRKWSKFGHLLFSIHACFYTLFLALLSYALVFGATRKDPNKYEGSADNFRLFCEVCSIIFVMIYIIEEICEIVRESKAYFKDPYNYFDWLGLILVLIVIPLRFADVSAQWSIASLGYLFNFLRIFKFSCITRTTGLYAKTLAKIIYRDITRFVILFAVVCVGFCGALFMALTATGMQDITSNYGTLMLAAVRVLTEQNAVEEDYGKFNWLTILILLAYMGMVIVILLNVLIAQLSFTYSEAKSSARLQYAVEKMSIVTRLEQSTFGLNLRVKYYEDGERKSETKLANELLEYSEERHPWESMEDKLALVREIMKKVIQRRSNKAE